jgi:hypothetical protein
VEPGAPTATNEGGAPRIQRKAASLSSSSSSVFCEQDDPYKPHNTPATSSRLIKWIVAQLIPDSSNINIHINTKILLNSRNDSYCM